MGEEPITGDELRLKGTRFTITFGAPIRTDGTAVPNADSRMKIKWTSRGARSTLRNATPWNLELLAVLEERLFINPRSIGGRIDKLSSIKGYSELCQ